MNRTDVHDVKQHCRHNRKTKVQCLRTSPSPAVSGDNTAGRLGRRLKPPNLGSVHLGFTLDGRLR